MPENEFDIQEKETKQYISVKIGEEKFGIDIGYVDNIVRMHKITRVPKAQKYFKGIINLRGDIVPVMSARIKMGLDDDVYTSSTRIIILKLEEKGEIGIIFFINHKCYNFKNFIDDKTYLTLFFKL